MPDLNDQLRNYIDGLGDPVTMDETTSSGTSRRHETRWRHPVPAAIFAGAAIVLLPALLLAGIRWWPTGDDVTGPTTVAPAEATSTTTTVPETTSTSLPTATATVVVPDVVGLAEKEARQVLEGVGLTLAVTETYFQRTDIGLIRGQWPEPGDSTDVGSEVVVGVAVLPGCIDWDQNPGEPAAGEMEITVLYGCAGDSLPDVSPRLTRHVPATANVIEATLRSLLTGPTTVETAAGFGSFFTEESADALNSVRLEGDRLTVDFNEAIIISSASTSNGSTFFMAELRANLFQFPAVRTIEFQVNGNCDTFGEHLQYGCVSWSRTDWEQDLAYWNSLRELRVSPGDSPVAADLVGEAFTGDPDSTRVLQMHTGGEVLDSGFSEIDAWLLDNPAANPGTRRNWAFHVSGTNAEMIWLVVMQQETDDGGMIYTVRAALELPWDEIMPVLNADAFVMNGSDECTIDQIHDPRLVAIGELVLIDDEATGATTVLRAWRIDVAGAAFEDIPLDDIVCNSDTF